jgi:hypothetical protein
MKIKFWQFEYDFDRDDAKIVIPIAVLLIAVSVTNTNPVWDPCSNHHILFVVFLFRERVQSRQRPHRETEYAMSKL